MSFIPFIHLCGISANTEYRQMFTSPRARRSSGIASRKEVWLSRQSAWKECLERKPGMKARWRCRKMQWSGFWLFYRQWQYMRTQWKHTRCPCWRLPRSPIPTLGEKKWHSRFANSFISSLPYAIYLNIYIYLGVPNFYSVWFIFFSFFLSIFLFISIHLNSIPFNSIQLIIDYHQYCNQTSNWIFILLTRIYLTYLNLT